MGHGPDVCVLQFVDMEGWTLLSGDQHMVPLEEQVDTELLTADLRVLPDAFPELYWQAPPSYLGDRVSGAPAGGWGLSGACRVQGLWGSGSPMVVGTSTGWGGDGDTGLWGGLVTYVPAGVILRGRPEL